MTKRPLQIHSENILPIIKRWLYSDKDIFVRELVSNSCDAIHKVKILRDRGLLSARDDEFKIEVQINKTERTLKFIDNGIGMDAEEVEKYIAQIAFSGAEEFLGKYQSNEEKDQFIGHFGLGFYSAYMVAKKVEINTLSYKDGAEPVFWSCDGSSDYLIEKGTRETRGTEITLFIDTESDEYLEEHRLQGILKHYCSFLQYPVYLGETLINSQTPLWIKPASECTTADYLEFYRYLYPMEEDPLFWVHLNVDYPFHLKGILYFPKIRRDYDVNKNTVQLYCNRVFVSDNCKDVIPNYLMVLRGVIDSPDIPLNVSRSYLQMDRTVRQVGSHVSKKVSDSLMTLYRNENERFMNCWHDLSMVVKLGILEDDKFYDRSKDFLVWKNTDDKWTTVEEYLERNREKTKDKILYTRDASHAGHFLDVYRSKGVEVLCADSPIDQYLMQFLERKLSPVRFQRIDAGIDDSILDKDKEKIILDASGKTEASHLADFVRSKLGDDKVVVEAKSLASEAIPGFVVIDEGQRRMRDYLMQMDPKEAGNQMKMLKAHTFVVNTNNPLMESIQKLDLIDPDLAQDLVKQSYELSLLSQREMDPGSLNEFIARNNRVLEKLAKLAGKRGEG
ncbi:MAG: molecular chaperone HtpG [Parachlamydiaceae bacterium]